MKIAVRISTILAVVIILSGFVATTTSAQHVQASPVSTTLTFHSPNVNSQSMSFEEVKSITKSSIREAIGAELEGLTTNEINKKLGESIEKLANGIIIGFSTPVSVLGARSITEQHTINVKASYEKRPIGGILTIKVEVVPVFSGIGSASRPVAIKELSQAVDNLDEDSLGSIISELSHKLGEEYAAK